jgi:hypothetical protein
VCKGSFEGSITDCFASRLAQAVQLAISMGILFSYALQMYVPIEILWPHVQKRWGPFKNSSLIDIIFRSSLVLITCKYVTYLSFSYKICVTYVSIFLKLLLHIIGPTSASVHFIFISNLSGSVSHWTGHILFKNLIYRSSL